MAGTVLHVNVDRCMTMWPKARDNDNGPLVQAARVLGNSIYVTSSWIGIK
jgi:hypothetical protein